MADFKNQVKSLWIRGMEAVGNTASNIASNTKYKVDEMNIQNKRRENINSLGAQAYMLWQKGVDFPEEMIELLKETKELDEKLNDMRTERYSGRPAGSEAAAAPAEEKKEEPEKSEDRAEEQEETEEDEEPDQKEAAFVIPTPADTSSFTEPIDSLFGQEKTIDALTEKVNDGLDNLNRSMKKFDESREE